LRRSIRGSPWDSRSPSRSMCTASPAAAKRKSASRGCCATLDSTPTMPRAIRMNSPAGSGSASRSHARWHSPRKSSSPTTPWRCPLQTRAGGGAKGSYHRRKYRVRSVRSATIRSSLRSHKSDLGISSPRTASAALIDIAIPFPTALSQEPIMKSPLRPLIIAALGLFSLAAAPAFAAKDVVFAVASTFTTTDPYDANDTLSQAMAKSFYEGLYGFDKDMKMIPVLAESDEGSKDGGGYTIKRTERHQVRARK